MERVEVDAVARLADLVDAAERGETVEIVRAGSVVATLVSTRQRFREQLALLHASLPSEVRSIDWSAAVREMRDED